MNIKKKKKQHKKTKRKNTEEYIGFKLIKPVPQNSLLPDYEKIKNSNIPSALKALYAASIITNHKKETIENQLDSTKTDSDQYQNDTSIKSIPVSKLNRYQSDTQAEETKKNNNRKNLPHKNQRYPRHSKRKTKI